MSELQIRITTSRPNWLERVWYRRLGELAPTATGSSGPWHAELVRLLPYRWRRLHQLYAFLLGFYWLPCPLCGREYGGHEHGADIPDPARPPYGGLMICSQCTITRNREADG